MVTTSPGAGAHRRAGPAGWTSATGSGSSASSMVARRVMLPVCQCSSWRPVISTIGYSASGRSSAGMMSAGTKRPRPVSRGKSSTNTTGSPGSPSVAARVGHRVLALQPLPGDAGDVGHRVAHLVEHLGRLARCPVEAEPARDLLDDPQVLACVAGRVDRLAAQLDQPVGVGEGAGLLRERAGRQDDVGEVGGLGEEDVLHHEVLERRERFARMVRVGVRHRRVLAHHVHAADLALLDRMHDLDHRQPRLVVERARGQLPGPLEARARLRLETRW